MFGSPPRSGARSGKEALPWKYLSAFMMAMILALLVRRRLQQQPVAAGAPPALRESGGGGQQQQQQQLEVAGGLPETISPPPAEAGGGDDAEELEAYIKEVQEAFDKFGGKFMKKIEKRLDEIEVSEPEGDAEVKGKGRKMEGSPDMAGKMDALIHAKMEEVMSSIEASVDRNLELSFDSKVELKVNRKIDFRIQKKINAGLLFAENPGGEDGNGGLSVDAEWKDLKPDDYVDESDPSLDGSCRGTSVTLAPKDYCGLSSNKPCMDNWELKYMMENSAKLQKGLETIRAPGCWPQGVSVAAMGYFRTGSTLLYNTARLWAALGAGESLVAGWLCKDPDLLGLGIRGRRQRNCSMVCKDHLVHNSIAKHAGVLLMSRRDPFYSICSRKLMDQWCKTPLGVNISDMNVTEYRAKCLSDPVIERNETIKQCHDLMGMQAKIYFERSLANKTIAHDVLMEDYKRDPAKEVQAVARGIGICEAAVRNEELVAFVVGMGKQLHDQPGKDMGITQMHDVHTTDQRKAKCSNLEAWMKSDPECLAWIESGASYTANGELIKMDEKRRARLEAARAAKAAPR